MTRSVLCSLAAAAVLLAAGHAHAQAYGSDAPSITTQNPTVGARGLYVIQEGDTLHDLSDAFLGGPWFWPNLWSYNPQITNPHWIYPGDVIQVREPQPFRQTTLIWSDSRYTQRKSDLEMLARYVGYLPDRPFRRSGEIRYARESHETLGEYDEVYISFGEDVQVKRGDRFTIYRNLGEVEHPLTGKELGYHIKHLGVAKVLDADSRYVKALILKSYEEIHRGDLVTSIFDHSWMVGPVTNEVDLLATLVHYHDPVTYAGQYQYVFIDKGRNEGVRRGNRFLVQRRGDGLWADARFEPDEEEADRFPWETYGEIMVVEAFEETSLGIVSRAVRELERGDRLVMQKGF